MYLLKKPKKDKKEAAMAFTFVCDVSGGMGPKIDAVNEGFKEVFDNILQPKDFIQLFTFGSATAVKQFARSKYNLDEARLVLKADGGGTALWDAINMSITSFPSVKNWMQKEYIILINGEDNCSKTDFSTVKEVIQAPDLKHLHIVFIEVGLETPLTAKIKQLCEGSKHCTYMSCGGDVKEIPKTFKKAQESMKKRREIFCQPRDKTKKDPQKKMKKLLEM